MHAVNTENTDRVQALARAIMAEQGHVTAGELAARADCTLRRAIDAIAEMVRARAARTLRGETWRENQQPLFQ